MKVNFVAVSFMNCSETNISFYQYLSPTLQKPPLSPLAREFYMKAGKLKPEIQFGLTNKGVI